MELKAYERLECLQCGGLSLIQSEKEYRFTTDAVILANSVHDLNGKTAVDLCSGSGVIALLVAKKKRPAHVYAVELQPQLADMAQRSVTYNNMEDVITVFNADVKNFDGLPQNSVDCVICNPPYRKLGSGETQTARNLALCRHEIALTLADVANCAENLLKSGGSFYAVYQSERLAELVWELKSRKLEPKEIIPVAPRKNADPNTVVVKAVKDGKTGVRLRKALEVMDENGEYTPEAKAYYGSE